MRLGGHDRDSPDAGELHNAGTRRNCSGSQHLGSGVCGARDHGGSLGNACIPSA